MNFLIYDHEYLSSNLINKILDDFHHIKLITSNIPLKIPSSPFLSINEGDIINASQVIQNLSTHDNDPFDAIIIFNLSLSTGLKNILQTIERLKNRLPYIFLIFLGQQNEIDQNIYKILKESSKSSLQWIIIICNKIDSSSTSTITKYHIETKSDPTNQQTINDMNLLNFIYDELKLKKYSHELIYLY